MNKTQQKNSMCTKILGLPEKRHFPQTIITTDTNQISKIDRPSISSFVHYFQINSFTPASIVS